MRKMNIQTAEFEQLQFDYRDKYLVLMDNVHQINKAQESIIKQGGIINESFLIIMIEYGECVATINGQNYSLSGGDLLVCTPGNFIENGMMSLDFRCLIFITFQENIGEMLKSTQLSSTHLLMKKEVGVFALSPEEQTSLRGFYRLIASFSNIEDGATKDHAVRALQQALAYTLAGLFLRRGITHESDKGTAAENTFRKFIHLLKEHPEGRSVQYYAERLSITPKYFNTICKLVADKTASSIINEEIVNIAMNMLCDHSLSVKQISSTLGFSNQSHFGSFMRRETGMSPQALRNKKLI